MINQQHIQNIEKDNKIFLSNEPFHHIVFDDFIKKDIIENVYHEIINIPSFYYDCNEHDYVQIKKQGLSNFEKFPKHVQNLVTYFNSPDMILYLQKLTNIPNLLPDPELFGGGIHKTNKDGHLAIHADFNIHPHTGYHRRLNLLLYLNPIWKDEWNGHLELWNKSMTKCEQKIAPLLNRVVIFRITDDAFHGHPEPLKTENNVSRYSLAFYYYTKDRPESEKNEFHWALWKKRFNQYF
jgi:Rps23 Pro-64 3,4-dihydroxylase Tpa1-like proline 4-hydroxylase